ncbi:MAG: hypothetical protein DRP09_17285 [Candidatus Thorarchaeota archaeon]|nr:MAG: hypothetical protein DRP09_17285 [Candidatus Thorarchaeota archaeon]
MRDKDVDEKKEILIELTKDFIDELRDNISSEVVELKDGDQLLRDILYIIGKWTTRFWLAKPSGK